jgi:uncharacterized membrane protein (DUF485 family)
LLYRLLADAVLIVHLSFVLWVALGVLIVWRAPWSAGLHIPAVAWGIYIELSGAICPLTTWEIELRERGGQAGYSGGFIDHYITGCLYPDGLTRSAQIAVGVVVFALNATIYWLLVRRMRRAQALRT